MLFTESCFGKARSPRGWRIRAWQAAPFWHMAGLKMSVFFADCSGQILWIGPHPPNEICSWLLNSLIGPALRILYPTSGAMRLSLAKLRPEADSPHLALSKSMQSRTISPQLRSIFNGVLVHGFPPQFAVLTQAKKRFFRVKMHVPQNRRNASVILDPRHS